VKISFPRLPICIEPLSKSGIALITVTPREGGSPLEALKYMDSRLRGNDTLQLPVGASNFEIASNQIIGGK
jgi:hypothetical protein